jgi:hypothetical protein
MNTPADTRDWDDGMEFDARARHLNATAKWLGLPPIYPRPTPAPEPTPAAT